MRHTTWGTLALAALLGASAVNHMKNPGFYYPVVPPSLCSDNESVGAVLTRHQWVTVSAVPEALAAVGLLIPSTRKAAATATALMFAGFTAGHVSALKRALGPEGTPKSRRIHALRLPLQVPLVVWAWRARRTPTPRTT